YNNTYILNNTKYLIEMKLRTRPSSSNSILWFVILPLGALSFFGLLYIFQGQQQPTTDENNIQDNQGLQSSYSEFKKILTESHIVMAANRVRNLICENNENNLLFALYFYYNLCNNYS